MPLILDPMSCGFAKIRCIDIFSSKKIKSVYNVSLLKMKRREFNSSFNELESFCVNQRMFRSFDHIVKNLQRLGKVNKVVKSEQSHDDVNDAMRIAERLE